MNLFNENNSILSCWIMVSLDRKEVLAAFREWHHTSNTHLSHRSDRTNIVFSLDSKMFNYSYFGKIMKLCL